MSERFQIFFELLQKSQKTILEGLLATLLISIIGLLIGLIIGTIIAISKVVPKYKKSLRVWEKCSDAYLAFFRGTPLIVQLLIGFYAVMPLLNIAVVTVLGRTLVAAFMFGLNSAAYVAEIMRSGINGIDKGQLEAGRALGMSYTKTMFSVVVPQAFKNMVPTIGNEYIALVKETSVVSMIAIADLTFAFQKIGSASYDYILPYFFLGLIYLLIVLIFTFIVRRVEKRLKKSEAR